MLLIIALACWEDVMCDADKRLLCLCAKVMLKEHWDQSLPGWENPVGQQNSIY